jgi:putative transposase
MSHPGGTKTWFTAADLAELALPGLPGAKRKINQLAEANRWALQIDRAGQALARPRMGRGGGLEYHVSLLPPAATTELVKRGLLNPQTNPAEPANAPAPDQAWAWFDRQPDKVKAEAKRRLLTIEAVERMERGGHTRTAAIATVAGAEEISCATVWGWIALAAGAGANDRLPRLAPRRQGGGAEAEIDDRAWQFFKSDYLRPERPTMSSCYRRLESFAAASAIQLPHLKTLQRKLEREVDGRVIIARREGFEALRRVVPAQQRDVSSLAALQLVNIDGHKWDVFVRWPDGHIARPIMIAVADIMSRKFLGWRIGQTESAVQTRLVFGDVFQKWGIPTGCLLDNGRAFASKWITGGAPTRFRFKIRPEDPTGLLTSLGIQNHWATPYRGQSKPIERAFRDLCDEGAKHPAFAGAYTGNRPDAKPDNYGDKAIPLEVFVHYADAFMHAHNARQGRRTQMAQGRSFDEAFAESYARTPIRRATPEQMRLALLTAENLRADSKSGAINFHGNRYWTDRLSAVAGERVVVRFDPDNLHSDIHVYALDGRYLTSAPVIDAVGFLDIEAAKVRAKQEAELKRRTRELIQMEGLLSPDELVARLPDFEPDDAAPAPSVIRPVRVSATVGQAAAARRPQLIDSLNFEDLVPARTERAALRLVE